jgi:hypothetical protein
MQWNIQSASQAIKTSEHGGGYNGRKYNSLLFEINSRAQCKNGVPPALAEIWFYIHTWLKCLVTALTYK